MKIDVVASKDVNSQGGGSNLPCIGLASDAFPEVQKPVLAEDSNTGVSTQSSPLEITELQRKQGISNSHWYALRTTYGREKKSYAFFSLP